MGLSHLLILSYRLHRQNHTESHLSELLIYAGLLVWLESQSQNEASAKLFEITCNPDMQISPQSGVNTMKMKLYRIDFFSVIGVYKYSVEVGG